MSGIIVVYHSTQSHVSQYFQCTIKFFELAIIKTICACAILVNSIWIAKNTNNFLQNKLCQTYFILLQKYISKCLARKPFPLLNLNVPHLFLLKGNELYTSSSYIHHAKFQNGNFDYIDYFILKTHYTHKIFLGFIFKKLLLKTFFFLNKLFLLGHSQWHMHWSTLHNQMSRNTIGAGLSFRFTDLTYWCNI